MILKSAFRRKAEIGANRREIGAKSARSERADVWGVLVHRRDRRTQRSAQDRRKSAHPQPSLRAQAARPRSRRRLGRGVPLGHPRQAIATPRCIAVAQACWDACKKVVKALTALARSCRRLTVRYPASTDWQADGAFKHAWSEAGRAPRRPVERYAEQENDRATDGAYSGRRITRGGDEAAALAAT
jgi:hypothetical protein